MWSSSNVSVKGKERKNCWQLFQLFWFFPFLSQDNVLCFSFLSSHKLFCQHIFRTESIVSSTLKCVMNLEASGRVETLHQNDLQFSDVSLLVQLPQNKMWVCSLYADCFYSLVFLAERNSMSHCLSYWETQKNWMQSCKVEYIRLIVVYANILYMQKNFFLKAV